MKTIIQLSEAEEAKALLLLLRHSPGTVLPNRTYVVSAEAAKQLREAGVQFTELSRESNAPSLKGVGSGERI
jgi:hypothetical protein